MNKIQHISKFFKWVFIIIFILTLILFALFWINTSSQSLTYVTHYGVLISYTYMPTGIKILHNLSMTTKFLGFLIGLIPLTADLLVLYFLIKLFKLFEMFEIFSHQTVRYIKYIGYALLISQILRPIHQALLSTILTWHNSPGKRIMTISFSGSSFGILLMALLIILISWIISEAQKIQEDQKYTI